jgi:leader peptidase (prepilin peptidase)/N-methyltransferase
MPLSLSARLRPQNSPYGHNNSSMQLFSFPYRWTGTSGHACGLVGRDHDLAASAVPPDRMRRVLMSERMHTAQVVTGFAAGLAGLPVGSYATVLAARIPEGQNVLRPAGRCPRCGSVLTAAEMVPVLSWLWQRGRCAPCGQPYGRRYLAAELITATAFAALGFRIGPSVLLAPLCYLSAVGMALALIDIDYHRLPHALTITSYPVVAALLTLAAPFTVHGWEHLTNSMAGMTGLYLFYAALACAFPGQMGWGDVWLAGLLGLPLGWLGLRALITGTLAALLLAWPAAIRRIAVRRHGKPVSMIPLGPFMLAGALLAILAAGL